MNALQKILRKLQSSSKEGVFNLYIKTAAPTRQQFLQEQERRRQLMDAPLPPPPEQGVVPTQAPPIPTSVVPMQPESEPESLSPEQVETVMPGEYSPEEVSNYMDHWVYEHRGAMSEYEKEVQQARVTGRKPPSLEDMEIGPDLKLYKMLMKDPSNVRLLIEKVESAVPGSKEKANLFVGTMLNATKFLFEDIEEANKAQQERDVERLQYEQEKAPIEDTPVELPDKHFDVMAHLILVDDRIDRQNILKMWRYPEGNVDEQRYQAMVANAAAQQLGAPEPGQSDPRIEFFLRYPKYLEPIVSGDPNFQQRFLSELGGMGLSGNVSQDLPKLFGQKNKGAFLNFLAREKGEEMLKILDDLVGKLPEQPDLMAWLKKGIFETEQEQTIGGPASFFQGGEEGEDMAGNLQEGKERVIQEDEVDAAIRKKKELAEAEATMDRATKKIAAMGKYYLKDEVEHMRNLAAESVQTAMDNQIELYKSALEAGDKGKALRYYTQLEKINALAQGAFRQLDQLFIDYRNPRPNKKDVSMMKYENNLGTVSIPTNIIQQIFGFDPNENRVDRSEKIENFQGPIDAYKEKVRSGAVADAFMPEWRRMVNYRVPFLAMAQMGKIKSGIIELASPKKGSVTLDSIFDAVEKTDEIRDPLNEYVGVPDGQMPTPAQTQKKKDFIFMTLQQNERHKAGLKLYLNKYEQKKEIEKTYADPRDILKAERDNGKNMNTDIGTMYAPMLHPILEVADKYPPKVVRGFIDLFDHARAKIRGHTGTGRAANEIDPEGRTNTELYYLARGEEMPEQIKEGLIFSKDVGLSKLNEKLTIIKNQMRIRKERQDKARAKFEERLETANRKLYKEIGRGAKSENVALKNFNRASEKIKDPNERQKFLEIMGEWKRTGDNTNIPYDYYVLFPHQAKTKQKLEEEEEKIKKEDRGLPIKDPAKTRHVSEMGLIELEQLRKKRQEELDERLAARNLKASEHGSRLLMAAYPRFLNKMQNLIRMRESNYKISCSGAIDAVISSSILEYNQFIASIFPQLF